jgi:hypothetical protein
MSSSFTLKRKTFASELAIGNEVLSGAAAGPRSQAYYDEMFKDVGSKKRDLNKFVKNELKSNQGIKVGSTEGQRASVVDSFTNKASSGKIDSSLGITQPSASTGTAKVGGTGTTYKTTSSLSTEQASKNAFKRGQNSTGIGRGAMNTWNRMGTMGKIGTAAGLAGGAYLIGKGLFGGKKKD